MLPSRYTQAVMTGESEYHFMNEICLLLINYFSRIF